MFLNKFNNLKDNQKFVFCKILTEVIKADGIVISKESIENLKLEILSELLLFSINMAIFLL